MLFICITGEVVYEDGCYPHCWKQYDLYFCPYSMEQTSQTVLGSNFVLSCTAHQFRSAVRT